MAMKPKVAARVAARKQAVGAMKQKGVKAGEARKRFYVQTRAAELSAKGVKVDKAKRQELRKKFESGSVARAGFYKKGEKAAKRSGSKSATTKTSTVKPVKSGKEYMDNPRGFDGGKARAASRGKGRSK